MAVSKSLREAVARAPGLPGVYSFLDSGGTVLYIGKAKDLRKRLRGHLSSEGDARHRLLLDRSVSVEWTITNTEVEALVLEAELIRIRKPPLNVRLRTSGRYPYIEITTDETWPRLQVTRERTNPRERPRFGPYPDTRNLRKLVEFLLETNPIRRCKGAHPPSADRPCLMGQMGRCPAPCCGGVSIKTYMENVNRTVKILRGNWDWARQRLKGMMEEASRSRHYEEAGRYRDLISRLGSFGWPAPVGDRTNRDVAAVKENWGVVMRIRGGRFTCVVRIPFHGRWKMSPVEERISILLRSYYSRTLDVPGEVLLQEYPEDGDALSRWLTEKREATVRLVVPQRGSGREVLELALKNLSEFLVRLSWKHPSGGKEKVEAALESLADVFSLDYPPQWIVCLDASTIQGSWPVAALVSFRDGYPDRSGYRRFTMPEEIGRNDPAMISSAVERYLNSLEEDEFPDIFLVDGGITQLRAAAEAAGEEWCEKIRFVSIAKKEELLMEAVTEREIRLPMDSTPLTFLRSVRDEAHRFVLHYHQQKRSKGSLRSVIDDIPGIGSATRIRLLTHFGSAERVAAASEEEIMEVPGIGRKRAMQIHRYFLRELNNSK
ncbi:MAG: excinuclease ABC subunit UvrC [Candidatus Aegiribacteria sp.]|nr:excinuclease ABC subunit UvrC [Candidatus Aegiribacteria sp.]MBD3294222.1 excinuclease ABC subunit UvrC [Candidatus Fermentibacteria bacterium]